jgi:hypothetical protein
MVQVVEAHSVGDDGWSETYHMVVRGSPIPLGQAQARHALLIGQRKIALPQEHIIEYLRVSDVAVAGDSKVGFPPKFGLGAGPLNKPPTNPCLGYFMTTSDISGTIGETRIYRGWAADDIAWTPGSPRTTEIPAGPKASLINIAEELRTTRNVGGTDTSYCLKSFLRPGAPNVPLVTGLRVTVGDESNLVFTFDSVGIPIGWAAGERIHVAANRVRCVRGVSGLHLLTAVTINAGVVTAVTNTIYDCPPIALGAVTAKAFLHVIAFYLISQAEVGGAGKRDTGRPFFLTRGRSPVRRR